MRIARRPRFQSRATADCALADLGPTRDPCDDAAPLDPRSVAILGAGAVGSYFGALLARAGFDVRRGKPTGIDAPNGLVARRGGELGIPTPVNRTLHALVKLREGECAP